MFTWWKIRGLHKAAICGDAVAIQHWIQRGAHPDARRQYGITDDALAPLHVAILHRSLPAVRALVENGASIVATCNHFSEYTNRYSSDSREGLWSALHLSVEIANLDMIKFLSTNGLCINMRTSLGKTPLHYAAEIARSLSYSTDCEKYLQVIRTLISLGADVNARDNRNRTPLFYAAATNGCHRALTILLEAGANVNAVCASGQNALFWADGDGVVELLLRHGIDHRIRDNHGLTALNCAQFAGIHVGKVQILEGLQ